MIPPDGDAPTVRWTPDPAESIRAWRFIHRRRYLLTTVVPLLAFPVGLLLIVARGWSATSDVVIFIWLTAAILTIVNIVLPAYSVRQARRKYPGTFDQEMVVRLDGDGMHASKGASSSDVGWSAMTDVVENPEFVIIRRGPLLVAVIPKRAFADSGDQASFVAVLRRHLGT